MKIEGRFIWWIAKLSLLLVIEGILHVSNLSDLNSNLIVNWLFWYANDMDSLWRKVVCFSSKSYPKRLVPNLCLSMRYSTFFTTIGSVLDKNALINAYVQNGFRIMIDNGVNANFLFENWTNRGPRKEVFTCIFALAWVKDGLVSFFGHMIQCVWCWNIHLHRQPLDWKTHIWDEDFSDKFIWTLSKSGAYTYQSFRKELSKDLPIIPLWKSMWWVHAPLKVKSFIWIPLHGRLSNFLL